MKVARRLGRLATHPTWAREYWRGWRGVRSRGESSDGELEFSFADRPESVRDERAAIAEVGGASSGEVERVLSDAWFPDQMPGDTVPGWSREVLLRCLAALVRLTRPRVVVEVGVERGYSSATILAALEERGEGALHSVDIPPLREAADFTGKAIPERLRARWQLTVGPSRRVLGQLAERVQPVDLFVHDGDHSYDAQLEDLEVVWPRLRPGAIVLVDDVWTAAVFDFAESHGTAPIVIQRADSRDGVGLLRKPRAG